MPHDKLCIGAPVFKWVKGDGFVYEMSSRTRDAGTKESCSFYVVFPKINIYLKNSKEAAPFTILPK